MPPRVHLTEIHQVNPAVSHPETPRSRNKCVSCAFPLPHPSIADYVPPTHDAPQGTNCGRKVCIGCTLRGSYAPGPNRYFFPISRNKYRMDIFETIRQILAVLIVVFSLRFSIFWQRLSWAINSFTGVLIEFLGRILNILTEKFSMLTHFKGVPTEFFRRIFSFWLIENI